MSTILKGLLLTLIAFILAFTQTNGVPTDLIHWEVLGIVTIGTAITYFGQSYLFPTTSFFGVINLGDFLKGLIIVVGTFISTITAGYLTGTLIDFKLVFIGSLGVIGVYLVKQFGTAFNPAIIK